MVSSGLRIGTPAQATHGFADAEFPKIGHIIAAALTSDPDHELTAELRDRVSSRAASSRSTASHYGLPDQRPSPDAGRVAVATTSARGALSTWLRRTIRIRSGRK